ncbi:hypothetical protein JCM17823_17680 [Halorubrum gandharaense]
MAVYVALFLLVGTAAGALIVTADTPEIAFDDPDFELSEGDAFELDGQEYTVAAISEAEDEETGEVTFEGVIEWEEITDQSDIWANESTVEVDDREWMVVIEGEEPTAFTLREVLDRQAILEDDPDAANETVEQDGEEYVVVTDEDGEDRLVPADEYFPEPEERTHAVDDVLSYDGQDVTVTEITEDDVTVEWEGPETMSVDVGQHDEVTLGDTVFIANFPGDATLQLSTDFESFEAQLAELERLDQQTEGLWRVLVISMLSVVLVTAMAFVPTRY